MSNFDESIRAALSVDEEEFRKELQDEPTLMQMVGESFRGRHRGLVIMVWAAVAIYTALMVFSAIRFFAVEEIRSMLLWGGLFGFSLMAVTACKIWYWMELNKNAVTREVKRLELQIAHLAAQMEQRNRDSL